MFKKLACFTGWLVVLCLSLLFCFTLGLWQNWRTSEIILCWLLMLLAVMVLWGGGSALRHVFRSKSLHRLVEKYRLSRREFVLLTHWKAGADVIKRLRRKRCQLPWFLFTGEHCGKSTLLGGAGLPLFYGETDSRVTGPTRMLRWWFFRNLCVLDLSGNFLSDDVTFRQLWLRLSRWLMKMPPPEGIIVAVSVNALMNNDIRVLHATARKQRALMEPLLRRFRSQVPVHVMVMQCDLFPGFGLWQRQLSEVQRQQSLGHIWCTPPRIDGQDPHSIEPLFESLKEGFSSVRLAIPRPNDMSTQDYQILLDFPEQFVRLEPAMRYFLASLSEPNAYFSPATLNSVWFTAAIPGENNRGRRDSLFVLDLLTEKLPLSGQLSATSPLRQHSGKRRLSIALLTLLIIWIGGAAINTWGRLKPGIKQLSPDAAAELIKADEQHATSEFMTLPFAPVLSEQQRQSDIRLAQVALLPRKRKSTFAEYQQRVYDSAPRVQRQMMLQLADAVLTWEAMHTGAPLAALEKMPAVSMALQQYRYPETLSPLAILAIERQNMQRPEGERWLGDARQLLINLASHDPELNWLLAPSEQIPPVRLAAFWPSLPDTVSLSGIWTHQGGAVVTDWMDRIERATGGKQPVFDHAREQWQTKKQAAWGHLIIDVSSALTGREMPPLTRSQLVAIAQGQSPSIRFVDTVLSELSDIPPSDAASWLSTLRHLQRVTTPSSYETLPEAARRTDARVRASLMSWLKARPAELPSSKPHNSQPDKQAWAAWEKVRNDAVNEATAQMTYGDHLIRGVFRPAREGATPNPLTTVLSTMMTLRGLFSGEDNTPETQAVWTLYGEDAHRLLLNAITQSACWLNDQWKRTVIWPLGKGEQQRSYEDQLALGQARITQFLQGPAQEVLVEGSQGSEAASYGGITVPLTEDFIRLAQQVMTPEMLQDFPQRELTQKREERATLQVAMDKLMALLAEQESKSWKNTLQSMPATVPGGARVIPVGTQLTLHCQAGDQQLNSMNFADSASFTWRAKLCTGVTLGVVFPDFTAHIQLEGEDAWPRFIGRFTTGEALFDRADFGDNQALLGQLGIEKILVRFKVSGADQMLDASINHEAIMEKIDRVNEQIAQADARLEAQVPQILPDNMLSALPTTIAKCP